MPAAHVALIPSPGMGHIIPFVQLAIVLSTHQEISSTMILTSKTKSPPPKLVDFLTKWMPTSSNYSFLPPPVGLAAKDDKAIEIELTESLLDSLPAIKSRLEEMKKMSTNGTKMAAVVLDPFGLDLKDVTKELGLPTYMFFGTAAINLLFSFDLPKIHAEIPANIRNFKDLPKPIMLPGCPPLKGSDFGDPFLDRKDPVFKLFLEKSKKQSEVDGILINTFDALEPNAVKALADNPKKNLPIVYPIGPLVNRLSEYRKCEGQECEIIGWLDKQPKASVLFLAFGSGGSLSVKQTTELANGLEMSGKGFLWAMRKPGGSTSKTYIGGGNTTDDDLKKYLPEGFFDRVKGRGMVLSEWAPQARILAHPSTGGFLTHCGWNSVLESIANGVPMIAWPLYAEQRTNAVELVDGLKVGIRPKNGPDGVVGRKEVKRVTEELMGNGAHGGLEARTRATKLKEASKVALEEGGTSWKTVEALSTRLKGV